MCNPDKENHMTNIRPAWERNTTFDIIYRSNLLQLCNNPFLNRVLPLAKLFDMEIHTDITNTFCLMSCPFMFKIQRWQRFYGVLIYISKGSTPGLGTKNI